MERLTREEISEVVILLREHLRLADELEPSARMAELDTLTFLPDDLFAAIKKKSEGIAPRTYLLAHPLFVAEFGRYLRA